MYKSKNTFVCNKTQVRPSQSCAWVCMRACVYVWIGLGRPLERGGFSEPMVFCCCVNNRQRHHFSQIRLLLLFQWKLAAKTHPVNFKIKAQQCFLCIDDIDCYGSRSMDQSQLWAWLYLITDLFPSTLKTTTTTTWREILRFWLAEQQQ